MGASKTAPTSKIVQNSKARFGVNGGYFNLSNGESASYVVLNGVVCADPTKNLALTKNPKLKPFLAQIYNRSEIRFLKTKDKLPFVQIATHNEPLPPGRVLEASLQGGPRLLPELTAEPEAFVRTEADGKQVDSIGVGRTAARTAVGFTSDDYLLIVAVAGKGQDEFSSGLTLADLAKLLKNLGAVEAVNLDGGTSTTMIQASPNGKSPGQMLIGRTPETRVRSALLVFE
ncbi:phosphodiester glycosidase family protein [bacterium]|nr:phosphodiester glycosidase family protein [bacterium]MBP9810655.1 phosphodiester glycosidase family protein [bacterium]